jgi:5'(3')-deoxyribonucleotidase
MALHDEIAILDVDGVFANFTEYYLEIVNEVLDTHYTESDIVHYGIDECLGLTKDEQRRIEAEILGLDFARNLSVLPGSVEGYRALAKVCTPIFCTSIKKSNYTWTYDRAAWLDEHLFGSGREVAFTKHKYLVQGRIFVDDMPYHVEKWMKWNPKGTGVLWKRWYNEGHCPAGATHTNDWDVLKGLMTDGSR